MKRIDHLVVTTSAGQPSLGSVQAHRALREAGFNEGDIVSIVLTSDLPPTRVLQVEGFQVNGGRGAVRAGQRRRFSLDPQSVFTVTGRDSAQPQYWRCRFDGFEGRVVEYLGSYIEGRSLIISEVRAPEETPPVRQKIVIGQRRTLNHDPQQPFTIVERDIDLPRYWKIQYDGNPGVEATFGEEYIHDRSTVTEGAPPASLPPFLWWNCYTNNRKDFRRVLARTGEEAQKLANSEPGGGYFCIVAPLGQ